MTKDEALDLALEFFETMQRYKGTRSNIFIRFEPTATGDYVDLREFDEKAKPIITAIKQARSAPVQEPVAFNAGVPPLYPEMKDGETISIEYTTPPAAPVQEPDHGDELTIAYMSGVQRGKELAAQRQWVGLTDDEFENIELGCRSTSSGKIEAMRKVEAKLKEKNT
jgi:hypothetical protein